MVELVYLHLAVQDINVAAELACSEQIVDQLLVQTTHVKMEARVKRLPQDLISGVLARKISWDLCVKVKL